MRPEDDPILKSALEFWAKSRLGAGVPTRTEIDPLRLPVELFPYLILADVQSGDGRVRYRLVGGEMVNRWGQNFTGRTSDEIFTGDYRTYMERAFALCVAKGLPVFSASRFRWDVDGYLWTRRVMLPIAGERGGPVKQVLVVQTWPNDTVDGHTDPMVISPGTAPVENAPLILVNP